MKRKRHLRLSKLLLRVECLNLALLVVVGLEILVLRHVLGLHLRHVRPLSRQLILRVLITWHIILRRVLITTYS